MPPTTPPAIVEGLVIPTRWATMINAAETAQAIKINRGIFPIERGL